jgi:hypothetical protein
VLLVVGLRQLGYGVGYRTVLLAVVAVTVVLAGLRAVARAWREEARRSAERAL